MLTPERITDLTEAEELESGYYVLVDSPTLGTRKIAAENFIPPEPTHDYLYYWDFTKAVDPLVDEVGGVTIQQNSGTITSDGILLDSAYDFIRISDNLNMVGKTIEVYVKSFQNRASSSSNVRFIMNTSYKSYGTGGLIYKKDGGGWCPYGYTSAGGSDQTWGQSYNSNIGINDINGKTVKLIYDADKKTRTLYFDDVLIGVSNDVYINNVRNSR